MLHEPSWSEHSQCQVYFSRNMNSSLPAPLTGSEERCSALKGPAAAGLDQKFWCKQNLHRLYLWFFSAICYSVAWFSPRSCILFWLWSLDGQIPRANSKCISCGLNRAFVFKLDSIPTLWCVHESVVPNMQELIKNLLPFLSSALKWAFRGVLARVPSPVLRGAFWPPAVGSHWKQLHCWSRFQHDRIDLVYLVDSTFKWKVRIRYKMSFQ